MNKKLSRKMSAGTTDNSSTNAEEMQVSPAIAKPIVSSSPVVRRQVVRNANKHISFSHPVQSKSYVLGQKIRKYKTWFCHNDALSGWFVDAVIVKEEHWMYEKYHYWCSPIRAVSNGYEITWYRPATPNGLCDFYSDCGFVQILSNQLNLQL